MHCEVVGSCIENTQSTIARASIFTHDTCLTLKIVTHILFEAKGVLQKIWGPMLLEMLYSLETASELFASSTILYNM